MSALADDHDKLEEEARQWLTRLASDDATEAERTACAEWRASDPHHEEVFQKIERVWNSIPHMEDLRAYAVLDDESWSNRARTAITSVVETFRRPATGYGVAFAAGLVLVVAVILTREIGPQTPAEYATEVAQIRDIELPDGSQVTLGARSIIAVDYNEAERRIILTKGEALFDVAKDPDRPFVVVAGDTTARALGTVFNVHRGPEDVRVSVQEGVVEVTRRAPPEQLQVSVALRQIVSAGQEVAVTYDGAVEEVKQVAATEVAAWRSGRLLYDGATLNEVVADANRYFDGEIVLGSEEIGTLKITASFRTDAIDQLLRNLEKVLPLEADRPAPGRVVLREARSET